MFDFAVCQLMIYLTMSRQTGSMASTVATGASQHARLGTSHCQNSVSLHHKSNFHLYKAHRGLLVTLTQILYSLQVKMCFVWFFTIYLAFWLTSRKRRCAKNTRKQYLCQWNNIQMWWPRHKTYLYFHYLCQRETLFSAIGLWFY